MSSYSGKRTDGSSRYIGKQSEWKDTMYGQVTLLSTSVHKSLPLHDERPISRSEL